MKRKFDDDDWQPEEEVQMIDPRDEEAVVQHLLQLNDAEFLSLLRQVFEQRVPYPGEGDYQKNHYFLGVADKDRLSRGDEWTEETWSQWEVGAIAYPNPYEYTGGIGVAPYGKTGPDFRSIGPAYGFFQFGRCLVCHTPLASNATRAKCPICGYNVSLT